MYDRQTTFHFIPNIGIHVWQTDIHFISSLIFESTYDRRTDLSFHTSYWDLRMTDGQTFYFIPHIGIHVWQTFHFIPHIGIYFTQTDRKHFMSSLILESTYDRRTDISFHPLYWNPCMTDGQTTLHFIPHIGIYFTHTDRHFISSLILESMYDRWADNISFHPSYWNPRITDGQTTFHFIPHIGIHAWQTDRQHFISSLILESIHDRRTYISFHPLYWNPRMTDGQTTFHFIPHIGIHAWQTDRQHFISSLIFESTYDRRTDNISFHPSYWNPSKTDRRTNYVSFHPSYWNLRKTNIQTSYASFHPSYWNLSKTDRRTNYVSFDPSYWDKSKTDGRTTLCSTLMLWFKINGRTMFHFTHVEIQVRRTDTLHFISSPILESKQDKLSNISSLILESKHDRLFHVTPHIVIYARQSDRQTTFHFTPHWNPSKTDGQTFFIPHTRIPTRQTDKLIFISPLMFAFQTDGQTLYLTPYIGIQVRQSDYLDFISTLILQSK